MKTESEPVKQIREIIRNDSGNWRELSAKALKKIGTLTWHCQATYGDVMLIGGEMLRERVRKKENLVSKAWMTKEWKRKGELDLSWRKGIEMAWLTPCE